MVIFLLARVMASFINDSKIVDVDVHHYVTVSAEYYVLGRI